MKRSLIEYAYEFVSSKKGSSTFADIWAYVVEKAELSEEEASNRISKFYTNLMLDGRFVTLGENVWDLRTRHTFDKVNIDMKDVYSDVEASDEDSEEKQEEDEYNAAFKENTDDDSKLNDNIDGNEDIKEDDYSDE